MRNYKRLGGCGKSMPARGAGAALALPWHCSGAALALIWCCSGAALALLWFCPGFAPAVLWRFSDYALALLLRCSGVALQAAPLERVELMICAQMFVKKGEPDSPKPCFGLQLTKLPDLVISVAAELTITKYYPACRPSALVPQKQYWHS